MNRLISNADAKNELVNEAFERDLNELAQVMALAVQDLDFGQQKALKALDRLAARRQARQLQLSTFPLLTWPEVA